MSVCLDDPTELNTGSVTHQLMDPRNLAASAASTAKSPSLWLPVPRSGRLVSPRESNGTRALQDGRARLDLLPGSTPCLVFSGDLGMYAAAKGKDVY
jgi:hypothetical protein